MGATNVETRQKEILVWRTVDFNRTPGGLPEWLEPVFLVTESVDLRFSQSCYVPLMDYLCHCIARNSGDLRSHVRRIYLAYEHGLAGEIFAALIDLFIALGRKGDHLRGRMLELSKVRLDDRAYEFLRNILKGELQAEQVPFVPGSLLAQGVEGTTQSVSMGPVRTSVTRDPLIEARECLEYSQIEEARSILEQAVLQSPFRQDLHRELLDIYRSTRDHVNYSKMLRELQELSEPVPAEWKELAVFFRSANV